MEILNLKTNSLNQNNYSVNKNTPDFIGSLVIYPVDNIPEKCLPCDGYKLKINDYKLLHDAIGSKFNDGTEEIDEFRIPDYNITKRFLQPSQTSGTKIEAGLPNITGQFGYYCLVGTACDGAFRRTEYGIGNPGGGGNGRHGQVNINASRANSIYGKSDSVQPPSETVHVCIRYK